MMMKSLLVAVAVCLLASFVMPAPLETDVEMKKAQPLAAPAPMALNLQYHDPYSHHAPSMKNYGYAPHWNRMAAPMGYYGGYGGYPYHRKGNHYGYGLPSYGKGYPAYGWNHGGYGGVPYGKGKTMLRSYVEPMEEVDEE